MTANTTANSGKPLGRVIKYCPDCGAAVHSEVPAGDNRLRYYCSACATVHYENPKVVAGCVPVYEGKILLCKRAIPPRLGYWTLPAGFMELGESMAAAAARETLEEACATVSIEGLLASVNVVLAGQVHVFFRARLVSPDFAAGSESLAVALVQPADIPWSQMAFTSNRIALEQHLLQQANGQDYVWNGNAL